MENNKRKSHMKRRGNSTLLFYRNMKNYVFFIVILLVFPFMCKAQTLQEGTRVPVRIINRVMSGNNCTANAVVDVDVNVNGVVVIKNGTPVVMNFSQKEARWAGRRGVVTLRAESTTSIVGDKIALKGEMGFKGKNKKGLALGLGIGLGVFIWPVLYCLAIQGGEAECPEGTLLNGISVAYPYVLNKE